jgi:hypothetical protein
MVEYPSLAIVPSPFDHQTIQSPGKRNNQLWVALGMNDTTYQPIGSATSPDSPVDDNATGERYRVCASGV